MGIRIQPKPIDVPCGDPFEHDLLDRRESIEVLTSIIGSVEGPCVLAVDAGWGMGKTTFLKMWAQYMRNAGFPIVEFNAWETDFADDPFLALSAEITQGLVDETGEGKVGWLDQLKRDTSEVLRTRAIPAVGHGLSQIPYVGSTLAQVFKAVASSKPIDRTSPYRDAKTAFRTFRESLGDAAASVAQTKSGKPLVMVIDELDRCRPSYAVALLEVAKHLFAVDHIVFVLAIDRPQLTHSIKVLYGSEFDAEGYLRRFFDVDYRLPGPPSRMAFVSAMLTSAGVDQYFDEIEGQPYQDGQLARCLLRSFFGESHISLRRISRAIHHLKLVVASSSSDRRVIVPALVALLIIRTLDSASYHRFVSGETTDQEAVESLFSSPGVDTLRSTSIGSQAEALIVAAKLTDIRERMDEGSYQIDGANSSLDQPLYRRYKELAAKPADDPEEVGKRHADIVIRLVDGVGSWPRDTSRTSEWKYLGFRHTVERLELLSPDLKDESDRAETFPGR